MDRPIVIFESPGGKWSACSSVAILCHHVSRGQCRALILETVHDVSPSQVDQWLDSPNSAAQFRSVWADATAASLQAIESELAELPSTEVTDQLTQDLATVGDSVDEMRKEIRRAEIRSYLRTLEQEIETRIQSVIDEEGWTYKRAHDLIWNRVGFGAELAKWQKILEEV
jgi:hypothetical protein